MNKNNLYRLGALMYDSDTPAFNRSTTIRKIIEAYFVLNGNQSILCIDLPLVIQEAFDIELHIDEIQNVIHKNKYFELSNGSCQNKHKDNCSVKIKLVDKRFELILLREEAGSVYKFIEEYLKDNFEILKVVSKKDFEVLIENFLYSIFVQNMEKSSKMFDVGFDNHLLVKDLNFTDVEKRLINDFLDYDNDEKNKAIFDIGSLALEFIILNGNINIQNQESSILKKVLYLDTNIIFRLLGINGVQRKIRVVNLIKRCKETGQDIRITQASQKEFYESITRHLFKVQDTKGLIEYTDPIKDSIIKHYFDTRSGSVKYYEAYIRAEYESTIKELGIVVDACDYYVDAKGAQRLIIDEYAKSIAKFKQQREIEIMPDAINISYIHKLRGDRGNSFRDLKEFFLTSDKNLIKWEIEKVNSYPVAMYPSNWLSIILKFGSRTSDDYKSFVSFIKNVYHEDNLEPDVVLATLKIIAEKAISQEKQKALFDIFIENDYEESACLSTFKEKEEFATIKIQEYIDKRFDEYENREKENKIKLGEIEQKLVERDKRDSERDKKDAESRKKVIEAQFELINSNRKVGRWLFGVGLSIVSVGVGYFIYKIINTTILEFPNLTLNELLLRLASDAVLMVLLIPFWVLIFKKFITFIGKKTLKEQLLLKEITPEEIMQLLEI